MTDTAAPKTYGIFSTSASRRLLKRLRDEGKQVLEFAPYQIVRAQTTENENLILENITTFDWLIFLQTAAAEFFLESIKSKDIDLYDLDEIRIGVLGEMVSDILRFEQIHTDLIFNSKDDLSVLLENYSEDGGGREKILVVGKFSDTAISTQEFDGRKFEVTYFENYQIMPAESNQYARQKALLTGGAVDEFIIAAPNDLLYLMEIYRNFAQFKDEFGLSFSAADIRLVKFLRENNFSAQVLK